MRITPGFPVLFKYNRMINSDWTKEPNVFMFQFTFTYVCFQVFGTTVNTIPPSSVPFFLPSCHLHPSPTPFPSLLVNGPLFYTPPLSFPHLQPSSPPLSSPSPLNLFLELSFLSFFFLNGFYIFNWAYFNCFLVFYNFNRFYLFEHSCLLIYFYF